MTGGATAPLVVEFEVATSTEHAFETWVAQTRTWWPAGHTVSGAPEAIVFEPRVGGRIFERAADGTEHVWGEVRHWEPPHRVGYRWHLFFLPAEATEVDVTFTPTTDGTAVRLVQTGFDALGDAGRTRRERTVQGWAAVTGPYRAHFASHEQGEDRP